MKAEVKNMKAKAYEYIYRHIRKDANQRRREVESCLNGSKDMPMYRSARIKYANEEHAQFNVVCEEPKVNLKDIAQPIFTISKVLQKEGSGKVGSYTWPIWMVQLILEKLVNGMPPAAIP